MWLVWFQSCCQSRTTFICDLTIPEPAVIKKHVHLLYRFFGTTVSPVYSWDSPVQLRPVSLHNLLFAPVQIYFYEGSEVRSEARVAQPLCVDHIVSACRDQKQNVLLSRFSDMMVWLVSTEKSCLIALKLVLFVWPAPHSSVWPIPTKTGRNDVLRFGWKVKSRLFQAVEKTSVIRHSSAAKFGWKVKCEKSPFYYFSKIRAMDKS